MRLDDTVFEEVSRALGELQPDSAESAHLRAVPRFKVEGEAMIRPHGVAHASTRAVKLADISQCGVCILDRQPTSPGQQFVIYLPRSSGATLEVLCMVRQCRLGMEGLFHIGAEFTEEMEQRRRLVWGAGGLVETGRVEEGAGELKGQRIARARLVSVAGVGQEIPITLLNASADGFTLESAEPLAVGNRLVLEVVQGRSQPTQWLCTVIHVRRGVSGVIHINASNDGPLGSGRRRGLKAKLKGWLGRS
jgi:hypothetical protein